MARRKQDEGRLHSNTLTVMMTDEEFEKVSKAAEKMGMSKSVYCRMVLLQACGKEVRFDLV